MQRLDRYIFREILFPGLIALVALTFIVLIHKGGLLVDIIVRQSPTAAIAGLKREVSKALLRGDL